MQLMSKRQLNNSSLRTAKLIGKNRFPVKNDLKWVKIGQRGGNRIGI